MAIKNDTARVERLHANPGALAFIPRFLAERVPVTVAMIVPASVIRTNTGDKRMELLNSDIIPNKNGAIIIEPTVQKTTINIVLRTFLLCVPPLTGSIVLLCLNITPLSSTKESFRAMEEISEA